MRKLREDSHLPAENWKDWIWAMAPNNTKRVKNLRKRGRDQEGSVNSKIKDRLCEQHDNVSTLCGIYEWRITGNYAAAPRVVYVGSTCAPDSGPCTRMKNRILDYCKHGNHKRDLINEALSKGYELWVRFMPTGSQKKAEEKEKDLLKKYDYAWNKRNYGNIRDIL